MLYRVGESGERVLSDMLAACHHCLLFECVLHCPQREGFLKCIQTMEDTMSSNKPCDLGEQELIVKVGNKIVSAMDKDHAFTMSFKQVQKLFNSQSACAYSGENFSSIGDITFERINPTIGYEPGNVALVRRHLNQLKGDTIDRFIHMSGMSGDALADLFSDLARSLRKQFNKAVEEKVLQNSKLEQRIQAEVAAAKQPNGAEDSPCEPEEPVVEEPSEPTKGAKQLMAIFAGAKKKRSCEQQAARIIGDN